MQEVGRTVRRSPPRRPPEPRPGRGRGRRRRAGAAGRCAGREGARRLLHPAPRRLRLPGPARPAGAGPLRRPRRRRPGRGRRRGALRDLLGPARRAGPHRRGGGARAPHAHRRLRRPRARELRRPDRRAAAAGRCPCRRRVSSRTARSPRSGSSPAPDRWPARWWTASRTPQAPSVEVLRAAYAHGFADVFPAEVAGRGGGHARPGAPRGPGGAARPHRHPARHHRRRGRPRLRRRGLRREAARPRLPAGGRHRRRLPLRPARPPPRRRGPAARHQRLLPGHRAAHAPRAALQRRLLAQPRGGAALHGGRHALRRIGHPGRRSRSTRR